MITTSTDKAIRWSTAGAVIGVAVVATVVSYEHAYALRQRPRRYRSVLVANPM
jgi:hypothetical protein